MAKTPALDMGRVVLTHHAVERFTERYKEVFPKNRLRDPGKMALSFLERAVEDVDFDKAHWVRRIIEHKFVQVRYLYFQQFRFVIKEEKDRYVVLTIEIRRRK